MVWQSSALTVLAGVGAFSILLFAPIAGADDPTCEQPPPDQQQCQQNSGAGIADQVIDGLKPGQEVKPFIDPNTGKPNSGQAGLRVLINGVDTCLPVGVPAPLGADVRIVPGDMTGHCIVGP